MDPVPPPALHAAPGPQPAAPLVPEFVISGNPDLGDPAVVALLPSNPWVEVNGAAHAIRTATPFFAWSDLPSVAGGHVAGSRVPLSCVDWMALTVARPSDWLENARNVLLLSVRPAWFRAALGALISKGGLDLSVIHARPASFFSELAKAARDCLDDPRLLLREEDCFVGQPKANSGVAHAASFRFAYEFSGDMLVSNSCCAPLALLKWAVRPYLVRDERDASGSNFFRVLGALRRATAFRTEALKEVVENPTIDTAAEVAENLAETWKLLCRGAKWFEFPVRATRRAVEIDLAARLTLGDKSARSSAFIELFPRLLDNSSNIAAVVTAVDPTWSDGALLANWEQLASIVTPHMNWDSIACLEVVESDLKSMTAIIQSLSSLPPADRLAGLRKHYELAKSLHRTSKDAPADASGPLADDGFTGTSGLQALRSASFVAAREKVRQVLATPEVSFMVVLDTLLGCQDKVFYMVALGKFRKSSGYEEIEGCTQFIPKFKLFWAMSSRPAPGGVILPKLQGKAFDDVDVEHLLSGDWHKVAWVKCALTVDLWVDAIPVDKMAFIMDIRPLQEIDRLISSTLHLLRVESPPLPGAVLPPTSYRAVMDRLITQAKRCLAFRVGSAMRRDQERNWVGAFMMMMKEAGERWAGQFLKPVNLSAPLVQGFLSPSSFVLNSLDRIGSLGDHLAEYTDVIASLLPQSQVEPVETSALIAGVGDISKDINAAMTFAPQQALELPTPPLRPNPPAEGRGVDGEADKLNMKPAGSGTPDSEAKLKNAKRSKQKKKRLRTREELKELRIFKENQDAKKKKKTTERKGVK